MNRRDTKIITNLFSIARDMEPGIVNFRVAAAIYDRNRFICYGFNSEKTDPRQKLFSSNPLATCRHAEIAAIKNALNLQRVRRADFSNSTMYIARAKYLNKHKSHTIPGIAKPCETCTRAIEYFNFKNCVYTMDYNVTTDDLNGMSHINGNKLKIDYSDWKSSQG